MLLTVIFSILIISTCSAKNYRYYNSGNSKPDQTTTCDAKADIIFLYDASGSIVFDSNNVNGDPLENFVKMKQFMMDIVDEFNPIGPDGTQIAALCFSTDVKDHFYLNAHGNAQDVKDAISAFDVGPNKRTSIGKGLKRIQEQYFQSSNGGNRNCAKKFIILLTDGVHNEGDPFPIPVAQELKGEGVTIITVGIGQGTKESELLAIASLGFKFDVDNFSTLSNQIDAIVQSACAAVECTSTTGGDDNNSNNNNNSNNRKHRYRQQGQDISVSVPVNVVVPAQKEDRFSAKDLKRILEYIKSHGSNASCSSSSGSSSGSGGSSSSSKSSGSGGSSHSSSGGKSYAKRKLNRKLKRKAKNGKNKANAGYLLNQNPNLYPNTLPSYP